MVCPKCHDKGTIPVAGNATFNHTGQHQAPVTKPCPACSGSTLASFVPTVGTAPGTIPSDAPEQQSQASRWLAIRRAGFNGAY